MTPPEAQARLDGQSARLRGKLVTDDPHARGTVEHLRWRGGYREMAELGGGEGSSATAAKGIPWRGRGPLPSPVPQDFAEHAAVESCASLRARYRVGSATITRWRKEAGIVGGLKTGPKPVVRIPAWFEDAARSKSDAELAKMALVSKETAGKWRRKLGLPPVRQQNASIPQGFPLSAPGMTRRELAARYGRSVETIDVWLHKLGISARRVKFASPVGRGNQAFSPQNKPVRDGSRAGQAADYLRRFGPVVRCNAAGAYDPRGDHWRRGSSVLTADEIIERAVFNGWKPDAWREVRVA